MLCTPTLLTPCNEACHPPLSDPYKERRSPMGGCPSPERGPRYTGLLVSWRPHQGANFQGGYSVALESNLDFENRPGAQTLTECSFLRVMHAQKPQYISWCFTPISLHRLAYGGNYPGHFAPQRMPRKVLLGSHPAYSRDYGLGFAMQRLAPKP